MTEAKRKGRAGRGDLGNQEISKSPFPKRVAWLGVFAAVGGLFLWSLMWWQAGRDVGPTLHSGSTFEAIRVGLDPPSIAADTLRYLYDFGVVQLDSTREFEVFTVAHGEQSGLFRLTDEAMLIDLSADWRFGQNPDFPGANSRLTTKPGPGDLPGLYIYSSLDPDEPGEIVVRAHRIAKGDAFSGSIEFPIPNAMRISVQENFQIAPAREAGQQSSQAADRSIERERYRFSASQDGFVVFGQTDERINNVPILFSLGPDMRMDLVFVGPDRVHPKSHAFGLIRRDRHGVAWADLDGRGATDAFIARGGLRGLIERYQGIVNDELLIQKESGFFDEATLRGIDKMGCPGRQVSPVDFDSDGLLDIYVVCGRGSGRNQDHPNQLYRQRVPGYFSEVAEDVGLDMQGLGKAVWLDADGDSDLDLIWGDNKSFKMYVNEPGRFLEKTIGTGSQYPSKLAVADFDNDGDFDIFAASAASQLLLNDGGTFRLIDPKSMGLPTVNETASFVDFDNDGLPDLHVLPAGLFKQDAEHMFSATGLLSRKELSFAWPRTEICAWFDYDGDGDVDLLTASYLAPRKRTEYLGLTVPTGAFHLYRNGSNRNHWLQAELVGATGNLEAVGAKMEVVAATRSRIQQVGQNDGSHYSMGHYRLYFGLGAYDGPIDIRVSWPDGEMTEMKAVSSDVFLTIRHDN